MIYITSRFQLYTFSHPPFFTVTLVKKTLQKLKFQQKLKVLHDAISLINVSAYQIYTVSQIDRHTSTENYV